MRLSTIVKIVAALVLVLVVAVIAASKSLKSDAYHAFLAERVKAATGLDLAFAGPTKLRLGASPVLSFTGVTLSAGKGAEILYVDRIEARVALVPLALRQLQMEAVTLIRPVLQPQNLARLGQFKPLDLTDMPPGAPQTRIILSEVRVADGVVRWKDRTVQVAKALFRPESEAGGPLSLQVDGRWQDSRVELSGVVGPLSALGGAKPYPIQLKSTADGINLTLRGTMSAPLAGKGLDLEFRAQGEELADLIRLGSGKAPSQTFGPFKLAGKITDAAGPIALADVDAVIGRKETLLITAKGQMADVMTQGGVDMGLTLEAESLAGLTRMLGVGLPNAGPVKLSGRLADIDNGWRITGLKSSLGRSDLAGELSLVLAPHPRLYGRVASAVLNLGDFTLPPPRGGGPPQPSQPQRTAIPIDDGRILGVEPLPLDLIKDMDANLSLSATRLQLGPVTLSDASGELRMVAGRLALESFTARAGNGRVSGEARLDAAAKTPTLALRLTGGGVDPAPLTSGALKGAKADFSVDLKAQGTNLRNMAGSTEGSLALALGESLLAKDSGSELPGRLARGMDSRTLVPEGLRLRCLVARLPVKAGLISVDRGLAAESVSSGAMAMGSIDLRTEVLDITVSNRSAPPLRIKGMLGAPVVTAEGAGKPLADSAPCRTAQARRLAR